MPLKIEHTAWGVSPVILCDHCGDPIRDARDGNYQWQASDAAPDPTTDDSGAVRRFAFFTHKACSGAFEHSRGGASEWYAMELSDLLPALAARLRLVGQA